MHIPIEKFGSASITSTEFGSIAVSKPLLPNERDERLDREIGAILPPVSD